MNPESYSSTGFHQALNDEVGISAIGRGGMGVTGNRHAEMADGMALVIEHIFSRTQELDNGEREISESLGICRALLV